MVYPALVIIVLIAVMCILTAKEKVPAECEASAVTRPFYRIAVWLEKVLRKGALNRKVFSANEERFRILEPAGDAENSSRLLFIKKCGLCLLFMMVGL
jgi:hypothetical protein